MNHEDVLMEQMIDEFLDKFPKTREAYETGTLYDPALEKHPLLGVIANFYHEHQSTESKLMETLSFSRAMKEARRTLEDGIKDIADAESVVCYLGHAVRLACDTNIVELSKLEQEIADKFIDVLV